MIALCSTLRSSILPFSSHFIPIISSRFFSSSRCAATAAAFSLPAQTPPVPKKVPFTLSAHGKTWQDPYHWMRNTRDPAFTDYLNQENSYEQAFMADTETLQRKLFEEMKNRMPTNIVTVPERWGPWLYYQCVPKGKEYPVLCRKLETKESGWVNTLLNYAKGQFGREQILLDWNEIAEQYGYVHVGTCRVSPDHNFLAYTLDITGSEQFILQIKDLRSESTVLGPQVDGVVSVAWAQDGSTLFYTVSDENQRAFRVLCRKLGSRKTDDVSIFTETDSGFYVDVSSTKDGKFITVNSNSRTSSEEEVYVIDTAKPLAGLQRIHKRISGVQYFLEHHGGSFYVLTNAPYDNKDWSGGDYYLARSQIENISSCNFQNIILPSEDMSFQDMDIFNGHLVLHVNKAGCPMLCSINLPIEANCKVNVCGGGISIRSHTIFNMILNSATAEVLFRVVLQNQLGIENLHPWFFPLPSSMCSILSGSNHDFMSPVYRAVLSSPVMPDLIVDYDMSKRIFTIVQQEEVRGILSDPGLWSPVHNEHHDTCKEEDENDQKTESLGWKDLSAAYCCERKEVVSHDGIRVPLTILYSQKAWKRGQSPGLLQGYGAYGEVLEKSWSPERLSLLDRGWVVAFADVRGGAGDTHWHKYGSGLSKHNSMHDFISCGSYLVNEGYVHRDRLGAIGFSAGGLLVGASINMNPDLFRSAILKVPFLDVCNSLLDPSLPLTTLDYEEFGNPQIESQFESIISYSPYDNIPSDRCFPSVLVRASFHDSRVGVWESAKWVARVRDIACSRCSSAVILKTNMTGGHFGEGGCYSHCEETAYDYAFLVKMMNLECEQLN